VRSLGLKPYNYDPVVTGVFTGLGAVTIWYFSCLAVENALIPNSFETVAKFLLTMIATFVGAFLAFAYNSKLDKKKLETEKIELLFNKIHSYSRSAKKYLISIDRKGNDTVREDSFSDEARDIIYECEILKLLYFKELPLDPSYQFAELERLAGECDKHWTQVPINSDLDARLNAYKLVANEIENFDVLLKPINDWCLFKANEIKER
jgi:hypothetical protein